MAYTATVYGVMIASPADCANERTVVKSVIDDWNASHSKYRHIVLEPRGWDTHSSPELGDRPQAIINRSVLEDCDLLVATFWTRLGTPTGVAPSGTAEEIAEHISSGKPAMIYVSKAPVAPDSVDPEQYRALQSLVARYKEQGLVDDYESITEFRQKLTRQLAQVVNERFVASGSQPELADDQEPHDNQSGDLVSELGLGREAMELLGEAVKDKSGSIMMLLHMRGAVLQTNGRQFIEDHNPRTLARWRAAVDELQLAGCIEDRGYKGEVFAVTDLGYRVADQLGMETD